MTRFLTILAGAFTVFMVLAVALEREAFLPLLGLASTPASELAVAGDASDADIESTIRTFAGVMAHLYGSGGDPRFADRLPATGAVLDEILADITYLEHNQRLQTMSLADLTVESLDRPGPDVALLTATESWKVQTRWRHRQGLSDPPRNQVLEVRYRLERDGDRWRVAAWEILTTRGGEPAEAGSDGE